MSLVRAKVDANETVARYGQPVGVGDLYDVICKADAVRLRRYLHSVLGDVNVLITDPEGRIQSMLQLACRLESFDVASVLLSQRWIKLTALEGSDFPSPLHCCCMWKTHIVTGKTHMGSSRIASLLLSKGADPQGARHVPLTPLHLALMNGHTGLVKTLLAAGASVKRALKLSLFCAAWGWCVEGIFLLHSADPSAVVQCLSLPLNSHGDGMLNVICDSSWHSPRFCFRDNSLEPFERQVFLVDAVLSLGANVDSQCLEGRTPLHHAWKNSNGYLAYHLICSGGASLDIKDINGVDPLQYHTTLCGASSLVLSGRMVLHSLSARNMMKLLIRRNVAELNNIAPESDATALHYAVENPQFADCSDLLDLMLNSGSNPNVVNDQGETALYLAARHRRSPTFFKTLLKNGADPSSKNPTETTLQLLGQVEPYFGISQVAILLIQYDVELDLHALPTFPGSHMPFLELPLVKSHPYWFEFRLWLVRDSQLPLDPKERHRLEREHFESCVASGLSALPWQDQGLDVMVGVARDSTNDSAMGIGESLTSASQHQVAKTQWEAETAAQEEAARNPVPQAPLKVGKGTTVQVLPSSEVKVLRSILPGKAGQRPPAGWATNISTSGNNTTAGNSTMMRSTLRASSVAPSISKGEWEQLEGTPYYRRSCTTNDGIPFQQINKLCLSTTDFIPSDKEHAMTIRYAEDLYRPMNHTQSHIASGESNRLDETDIGAGIEGHPNQTPHQSYTRMAEGCNKVSIDRLRKGDSVDQWRLADWEDLFDLADDGEWATEEEEEHHPDDHESPQKEGEDVGDEGEVDSRAASTINSNVTTTTQTTATLKRQCRVLEELLHDKLAERNRALNKHDDIRFMYRQERACARGNALGTAREDMMDQMEIIRQRRIGDAKKK